MSELAPGTVIGGRYEIQRTLGAGGMGVVYAAYDRRIERRVAIKAILGAHSTPAMRSLLRVEAKAVGALAHPGVVALYDFVEEGDDLLLVMELVEGKPLRDRIAEGPLPIDEVARIVCGVAGALVAAHEKGLVHRDVKPDNVMLRTDGRIALLDFGVAKALGANGPVDPLGKTGTGDIKGTPAYLSPEQINGGPITPATDQFALAVVAYEMLGGKRPWPEDNIAVLLSAILDHAPAPLATLSENGPALEACIARALSKNPGDRYATVDAFANALAASLGSDAPSEKRASAQSPVALSVGANADIALLRTEAATVEPARPAPTSRSKRRWPLLAGIVIVTGIAATTAKLAIAPDASPAPSASLAASVSGAPASFSPTTSEAARGELVEALHLLAHASPHAREHLDKALALDPNFASAHLQRAILDQVYLGAVLDTSWRASSDDEARRDVTAAIDARDALPPRDAGLADALEALVRDPPDYQKAAELLNTLAARFPRDAEIPFLQGMVDGMRLHQVEAVADHHRSAQLDPSSTYGLWAASIIQSDEAISTRESFDLSAALADADACAKRDRTSIACKTALANVLAAQGKCADVESAGREICTLDPDSPNGFYLRAVAVASQGGTHAAVAKLLDDALQREHGDGRIAFAKMENASHLGRVDGDFATPRTAMETYFARSPSNAVDEGEELSLEMFDFETGAWDAGAARAQAQLALASARPAPILIYADRTATRLLAMRMGDLITSADYVRRVFAWLDGWRAKLDPLAWKAAGPLALVGPYGDFMEQVPSADEAKAILDGLEERGLEPTRRWPASGANAAVGMLLLAAGRLDEAQRAFETASEPCTYSRNEAQLRLAQIHARKGDKERACSYYAQVLARWGHAKPRSVTVEEARAGAKRLACPGIP